ncbi:Cu/Zn superoxide dismutase [Novosphingobium sp. Rr 2-17]|nr:Cu/Zn superoxide dismutase [Novosphingobium sp. Rr 2-17]
MRSFRPFAVAALALGAQVAVPAMAADAPMIHADVIDITGKTIGMVMVQQTPAGVLVTTDIKGLPEGDHGFHFHEKGICDPAQKFTTSGGHFATGHKHGLMTMGGPHGGDMPNQHVGADGVLKGQVLNTGVTLTPGAMSVFDADGTALVIHAKPDDYTSQPAGNAGDRLACAVIAKPK